LSAETGRRPSEAVAWSKVVVLTPVLDATFPSSRVIWPFSARLTSAGLRHPPAASLT
jgi:hypothetical protein